MNPALTDECHEHARPYRLRFQGVIATLRRADCDQHLHLSHPLTSCAIRPIMQLGKVGSSTHVLVLPGYLPACLGPTLRASIPLRRRRKLRSDVGGDGQFAPSAVLR